MENKTVSAEVEIEAPTESAEDGGGNESASADEVLETGIASIFALIRSGKATDGTPEGPLPEETGATYALLSELDRLWNSA